MDRDEVSGMPKAAALVFADTGSHADLAGVVDADGDRPEFEEAADAAGPLFDGAGTRWVSELAQPDHRSHRPFEDIKDRIAEACASCAARSG